MKKFRQNLAIATAFVGAAVAVPAGAQTNTFANGIPFVASSIPNFPTTGSLMGGMLVTWAFAGGGTFSSSWGNLGGGVWGISSGGFSLTVPGNGDTYTSADWTLNNNTNNRLDFIRLNGAPGKTVFDCGWSGTECRLNGIGLSGNEGTFGSNDGLTLTTQGGGSYSGAVAGEYTNKVQLNAAAPVGDEFEQLTIRFTNILGAGQTYLFKADTDNAEFVTTVTPEPGSYAMMLAGLAALGLVARRRSRSSPV